MKKNPVFILILVVIIAIAALFFVLPLKQQPFAYFNKLGQWHLGLDLVGGTHLVYEVDMSQVKSADQDSVMSGLKDVIEKRVNLFGVSEPQVVSSKEGGTYRLNVDLAGIKDVQAAINQIGLTPLLDFREVLGTGTSTEFIATNLTGRYITGARVDFDPNTGAPYISLEFNSDGAKIFEDMTGQNVGKPIAIFLDNNLVEAPTVTEKISGGKAQITGKFTVDEANLLVQRFNAGALPAPIKLVSQQTIGASLGQESLRKAIYAGILGTLAVILFMFGYYRKFGIFSAAALIIYVALTLAIFKSFITLSLAGIAGYILSIGMAVDANVLIFERTKEELKKGLSKAAAIEEGFRRAWPSIRDSNISTIITSVILYYFTSSFVRGFALTLLIGVLVSMFSAITVTRLLLRAFVRK